MERNGLMGVWKVECKDCGFVRENLDASQAMGLCPNCKVILIGFIPEIRAMREEKEKRGL